MRAGRSRHINASTLSTFPGPAGSNTTRRRSGLTPETSSRVLWPASGDRRRHRRPGHHQPAGDHRRLGPDDRPAHPPGHRGRTPGPSRSVPGWPPTAADRFRATTGLPLATYFAGPKAAWILDQVDGARAAATRGDLLGTIDSYLLWRMTGGPADGVHVTDVTNAARTMLMDLRTLTWDPDICSEVGVPMAMLPDIRSSSEVYGRMSESTFLPGTSIAGVLGDQQAATFGQACLKSATPRTPMGRGTSSCSTPGLSRSRASMVC